MLLWIQKSFLLLLNFILGYNINGIRTACLSKTQASHFSCYGNEWSSLHFFSVKATMTMESRGLVTELSFSQSEISRELPKKTLLPLQLSVTTTPPTTTFYRIQHHNRNTANISLSWVNVFQKFSSYWKTNFYQLAFPHTNF